MSIRRSETWLRWQRRSHGAAVIRQPHVEIDVATLRGKVRGFAPIGDRRRMIASQMKPQLENHVTLRPRPDRAAVLCEAPPAPRGDGLAPKAQIHTIGARSRRLDRARWLGETARAPRKRRREIFGNAERRMRLGQARIQPQRTVRGTLAPLQLIRLLERAVSVIALDCIGLRQRRVAARVPRIGRDRRAEVPDAFCTPAFVRCFQ